MNCPINHLLKTLVIFIFCIVCSQLATAQPHLYVGDINNNRIVRMNLDGSGQISFFRPQFSIRPQQMEVDEVNRFLYWTDTAMKALVRVSLAGGEPQAIIQGLSTPRGLVLDPLRKQLYFTEQNPAQIRSANLFGQNIKSVTSTELSAPYNLALNHGSGLLYVADVGANKILRVSTTGAGASTFVGLGGPRTLSGGLALDITKKRIYFTLTKSITAITQLLGVVNLNGTNLDPDFRSLCLPDTLCSAVQTITVDAGAQMGFWTGDRLLKAPLLPTSASSLGTGLGPVINGVALHLNCSGGSRDSDGDGVVDCLDQCALDPLKSAPGACGCGQSDIDQDRDGFADCTDQCPNDLQKSSPGVCGCGVADTDQDNDGTFDCQDQCPTNAWKTQPDECGCLEYEMDGGDLGMQCQSAPLPCNEDRDLDGSPDCSDSCPMNPFKEESGACGCTLYERDGGSVGISCAEFPILDKDTKILNPPKVVLNGRDVTLILQQFSDIAGGGLKVKGKKSRLKYTISEARSKNGKLSLRYEVRLKLDKAGPSANLRRELARTLTKKTEITFSQVQPGNFTARYRVQTLKRGQVVRNTKFSPAAKFEVK